VSISIIVPNFNHASFLKERPDSVFNQTYQDFEVILLDDCSTDNSLEVLQEYANHPKVAHFVINEQNTGSTFKQWKKGIELAKGEWIWIAESDDWCEPSLLQELPKLINFINDDLSRFFEIRHHYALFEFTVYVNEEDFIKSKTHQPEFQKYFKV
jgi:glycosyltransferase involved in cell wall biosynthesis